LRQDKGHQLMQQAKLFGVRDSTDADSPLNDLAITQHPKCAES
jgi:hypothetical protein